MYKAFCIFSTSLSLIGACFDVVAQPSFALNGSTTLLTDNCYHLTSGQSPNDVGSLWCEFPLELNNALDLNFAINVGCSKNAGEGFAFVMHTDTMGLDALGCAGNLLGFAQGANCAAIQPSLAVEIDTRFNRGHKDLYQPHLALVKDGNMAAPLLPPVKIKSTGKDLRDCEYHHVRITWKPSKKEFCVYIDQERRIFYQEDILQKHFKGVSEVFFGFTASSGQKANLQMICVQSLKMEVDPQFERRQNFEDGIGIYPNPINEKLTIDVNLFAQDSVQMQLFDSAGALIYEIPMHRTQAQKYYFNMPGLPTGVYYVTVTNGSSRISKRIVHISSIRA